MYILILFFSVVFISIIFSVFFRLDEKESGNPSLSYYFALLSGALGVILFSALYYLCYLLLGLIESKELSFIVITLSAGFLVEVVKFIILLIFIKSGRLKIRHFSVIAYSVAIAMGFAAAESVVWGQFIGGAFAVHILISHPAHASSAIIMGYFVGKADTSQINLIGDINVFKGILYAILFRSLCEAFFIGSAFSIYYLLPEMITLITGVFISVKLAVKARRECSR